MAKQRASELFDNIDAQKFNEKPDYQGWSIGECVDHLNKTGTLYLREIKQKARIVENKKSNMDRDVSGLKPRFISSLLIKSMEPPPGLRVKAPKVFKPRSELQFEETKRKFIELQDQFIEQFKYLRENGLLSAKMNSPATNLIKMELGEAFLLTAAHQRRHLTQAENLI